MRKNAYIGEIILKTLLAAGVISIAILAPNALQALKIFKKRIYSPSYINQKIKELEKQGYVKLLKKNNKIYITITEKGKLQLQKYRVKNNQTVKHKWDKKWRIIIFDIKEYRRKTRDRLRRELINYGFKKLQNSVWVSPYPCEEFIVLLKSDLKIGKDLLYMESVYIEGSEKKEKSFSL